jgi:hypothetical protein
MPAKKDSVEQIIAKLREHEKLQGQGLTVVQACKRIGGPPNDQDILPSQARAARASVYGDRRHVGVGLDYRQAQALARNRHAISARPGGGGWGLPSLSTPSLSGKLHGPGPERALLGRKVSPGRLPRTHCSSRSRWP